MTFSRAKSGGWSGSDKKLTVAQMNTIDTNQSLAVDGTGGGTYTGLLYLQRANKVIDVSYTAGGTVAVDADECETLQAVQLPKNPGSDLILQLSQTGISTGKVITFFRPYTAHSFACRLERAATGVYFAQFDSGTTVPTFVDAIFDGTTWRVLRAGPNYDNPGTDYTFQFVE